jgi:hypothetical protein
MTLAQQGCMTAGKANTDSENPRSRRGSHGGFLPGISV